MQWSPTVNLSPIWQCGYRLAVSLLPLFLLVPGCNRAEEGPLEIPIGTPAVEDLRADSGCLPRVPIGHEQSDRMTTTGDVATQTSESEGPIEPPLSDADGWFQAKLEEARSINNDDSRATALQVVAIEMAKTGRFDKALRVTATIANPGRRTQAFHSVLSEMAKVGSPEDAVDATRPVDDSKARLSALMVVVTAMVEAGRGRDKVGRVVDEAMDVAWLVDVPQERFRAMMIVLSGVLQAGLDKDVITTVIDETFSIVCTLYYSVCYHQEHHSMHYLSAESDMRHLRHFYVGCGDYSNALRSMVLEMAKAGLFEEAVDVARAIESKPVRARALSDIATFMGRNRWREDEVARVFEEALDSALQVSRWDNRSELLQFIGCAMAEEGLSWEALEVVWTVGIYRFKPVFLGKIAYAITMSETLPETERRAFLREVLYAFHAVADQRKPFGNLPIGWRIVDLGLFEEAMVLVRTIEDPGSRTEAIAAILSAKAGNAVFRHDLDGVLEAVEAAHRVEDLAGRKRALAAIVRALARAVPYDPLQQRVLVGQSLQILARDVIDLAEENKDSAYKTRILRRIIRGLTYAGWFEEALELVNAFDDRRQRSSIRESIVLSAINAARRCGPEAVLDIIENVPLNSLTTRTVREVAIAMAEAGMYQQALSIARMLEDTCSRAEVVGQIALAMAKAGLDGNALAKVVDEGVAEFIAGRLVGSRVTGQCHFAKMLAVLAEAGVDKKVFVDLLEDMSAALADEFPRDLAYVASAMAMAGLRRDKVSAVFTKALTASSEIRFCQFRKSTLEHIVSSMTRAGLNESQVAELLKNALVVIPRAEDCIMVESLPTPDFPP